MKILRIPLVIILIVLAGRTFSADAQTETVLYSFGNSPNNGFLPEGGVVQGSDGNFYGTTSEEGAHGGGMVFRISSSGCETNLYFFGSYPNDGAEPLGGLVQGSDGNFYGTTVTGGSNTYCEGCGTVFRISPSGTYTSLYSFGSSPTDGNEPQGALVQGSDGNFYGTTFGGGLYGRSIFYQGTVGFGTAFRISPSGAYQQLYSFAGSPSSDGEYPQGLVLGADGNFYGTTAGSPQFGYGTIFRISPSGSETNIHFFDYAHGAYPSAGLVQGRDGNFYGVTGGYDGPGIVFRISPGGSYTNLHSFAGSPNDGYDPRAPLLQGSDGNFYGTTGGGGANGYGTIFRISPTGSERVLYSFVGSPNDGANPSAGLVQGSDGNFYGTTFYGGTTNYCEDGCGTVFGFGAALCAYGINVSSSPAGGGSTSGAGIYSCGCNVTVCATSNSCYSFVNWTDQNSNVLSTSACYAFTVTTNAALVANFASLPSFTINTSSSPVGGGSTSGQGTYCNSNVTVCASPSSCYSFVNWTDQNSNVVSTSACYPFTATTNEALVANFTSLASNTITTSSSPAGSGSTSGGGTYCGSNVTVCATASSCYSFVDWTLNGNLVSTSACYSFTTTNNESLVANFTPASYTITTTNVLAGAGSTSGGGTVACSSEVTVCATPNPCYNFSSWSLLGGSVVSTSACYTFTATNSQTLVANFAAGSTYKTITTSNSPPGAGVTSGGGTVTCGSEATVCASANSCYSFADWTLNGNLVSTSACYSFTATTNGTLVANFAANGALTGGSLTGLWSFTSARDGANPGAPLVQGSDGNFYGTTYGSGSGSSAYGTVFRITTSGTLSNLHSFIGTDGANPSAGLVQGSDGNYYGTTYDGGTGGYGTVFRISSSGNLSNLWTFTGGSDGGNSYAGLVQGNDGNFYGTTYGSGSGPSANGNVFRISPSGNLSNLWSFTGGVDGANPGSGLVQGSDGNFYGTTYGSGSGPSPYGTVYRITPTGSLTTLWSFTNGLDGASSYATLVQGVDGSFYGTTSQGGANGIGTVFRISPTGNLTNLWEFTNCVDGGNPYAGLVQGSDGNFYGTTSGSGSGLSGYGSVFRISTNSALTILHSFGVVDGANPYAPLVQGSDGDFYGTTYQGGTNGNYGTVFRLSFPLNPPANQISGIQLMGTSLVVSIPSVAGETYQLQYSGSLTLSNWSNVGGASMTNSIGGMLSLTNLGGGIQPQGFYRFAITP